MSQSWNNVANMHELLTVYAQRKSKRYPAFQDCPLVQCACAMATLSLCSNIEFTSRVLTGVTKTRLCLLLCSRLGGLLRRPLEARHFTPFILECISMTTLAYAHGNTILTNCEPSELVAECIFCALQVMTRTICGRIWEKGPLRAKCDFFAIFRTITIPRPQEPQASHLVCK